MDTDTPDPGGMSALPAREKKPSASKALIFLVVLAIITALLAVFVISQRSATGPLIASAPPDAISVKVRPVELSDTLTLKEGFSGLTTARRTSMLGFQSGGRIERILVDLGAEVRAGQMLARLDTRSLEAQMAAAEASVSEARAGRDLAQTTVVRQQILLDKGHVSQQRVDEAQAQVDTANARINAAQAQVDLIQVQIDLARITAPFSGVVTNRFTDEGAIAAPGTPVLELVETGRMEARIGLPADEARRLVIGETFTLASDLGPATATLRAVTGVIDTQARTMTTVFDINDQHIPAGTVVRLALNQDISERGVWVPLGALTEGNRGLWSVYVAEPDSDRWVARKRPVEIVRAEADQAYVRGALVNGDQVILEGITRLSPEIPVSPIEAKFAERGEQ